MCLNVESVTFRYCISGRPICRSTVNIDLYIKTSLSRIVGDDDGGVLFTPEQYEAYKKRVAPAVSDLFLISNVGKASLRFNYEGREKITIFQCLY